MANQKMENGHASCYSIKEKQSNIHLERQSGGGATCGWEKAKNNNSAT